MAITLTVEDGTGLDTANTLVSLADFKSYCDGRLLAHSGLTDDALSSALVRASSFLGATYRWEGHKVSGRSQTMPFPRMCLVDGDGNEVPDDEVPREIVAACCELALTEANTPGALNPTVVLAEKVTSEQVGSIRVEYANTYTSASDSRPVLTIVSDLIEPFLANGLDDFTLLRV
jgi:hypothetical protein